MNDREQAITMLTAHLDHWKRLLSEGVCTKEGGRCVDCPLNYEQGTMGEQKEALGMAIKALEQIPDLKEAYNKGYKDGQKALAVHLELCKEEGSVITVPDGATNGDMIKAMFQNWTISEGETMVCFYIPMTNGGYEYNAFSKDWWNSPYRKEQE